MNAASHEAEVYENAIPAFVHAELERLYRNTFSSCLAEHVQEDDTHTYVAGTGAARTILLFKTRGHTVSVLNSAISLAPAVIQAFVSFIFARYPSIHAVRFVSVAAVPPAAYPSQCYRASEDYVLSLPPTVAAYDSRLGKATAAGLRTKANKLARVFPGHVFRILEGADIDSGIVEDIIRLKDEGGTGRGVLDDSQKDWLRQVVRTHGFVGVSLIDGRVCAGAICTRIDTQLFMHVLAHDRAFDAYSLGMLNSYLTVCSGIERGGKDFHFLWGNGVWKTRLKGCERPLNNLVVYRSRTGCLVCADVFAGALFAKYRRRVKSGLLDACAPESRHAWLVRPCLDLWRRCARVRA